MGLRTSRPTGREANGVATAADWKRGTGPRAPSIEENDSCEESVTAIRAARKSTKSREISEMANNGK